MSRLLFFGDSYVQGNGFPGIDHNTPEGQYSEHTFPTLTANILDLEYENLGFGGTSIDDAVSKILKYDIKQNDIVCLFWTDISRVGKIYNEYGELSTMLVGRTDKHSREFYKYLSDEKMFYDATINIGIANLYVKNKGATMINIPGTPFPAHSPEIIESYLLDWITNSYITDSFGLFHKDKLPDGHCGYETHKSFAEYLAKFIIDNNLLT